MHRIGRKKTLDLILYFCNYRNMNRMDLDTEATSRYARMLAAMGTGPRLSIVRLLLSAHPQGMVVGDIQAELGIPASTLSHHLEKLKKEGLANFRREGTFLWYRANTEAIQELLRFLFAECCTRNSAISATTIVQLETPTPPTALPGTQPGKE